MNYPHTFARVFNAPLMLAPHKLATIVAYLMPRFLGQEPAPGVARPQVAAPGGKPANAKPYHVTKGGAALIRVVGTLVQRGDDFMEAVSGLVSYDTIRKAFRAALADPEAKSILLEFDSPGGEVAGVFDLADEIYQARGAKPIWAVANEAAFSAAYALACAADRVFLSRTAAVGSVGVLAVHVDQSGADKRQGYAYTAVYAGAHKNDYTPHAPMSEGARGRLQAQVDQIYTLFVDTVARNRGLEAVKVRGTEAGVFMGEDAVSAGLADGVATMAEVLANIGNEQASGGVVAAPVSATQANGAKMENQETQEPKVEAKGSGAATPPPVASQPHAQESAQATAAERERVKGIMESPEAVGREGLAKHLAYNTGTPAPEAVAMLAAAPRAQEGNPLAEAMGKVENPDVGAAASASDGADGEEAQEAARIVAAFTGGRK